MASASAFFFDWVHENLTSCSDGKGTSISSSSDDGCSLVERVLSNSNRDGNRGNIVFPSVDNRRMVGQIKRMSLVTTGEEDLVDTEVPL